MKLFVNNGSVVKRIWGKGDTILFIFAGASAEFAVNKAVDWLYFTGKLPADPLGRLFSTVEYARKIVFSSEEAANRAIDSITAIHKGVEEKRGASIPDWAYRDVLFMLIDYSIRAFELLERPMTAGEKEETFNVFYRVGLRMGLKDLPENFEQFVISREEHLHRDLQRSSYSMHLYSQYRKHLGGIRFFVLKQSQALVVPKHVSGLLDLHRISFFRVLILIYKGARKAGLDNVIKFLILPPKHREQVKQLDAQEPFTGVLQSA